MAESEPKFAVVLVGGSQYKVTKDDLIVVERRNEWAVGEDVVLHKVALVGSKTSTLIGSPLVPGASVVDVEEHNKAPKVIVFKKKRRKNYQRWNGHRQPVTALRILDVVTDGPVMVEPPPPEAKWTPPPRPFTGVPRGFVHPIYRTEPRKPGEPLYHPVEYVMPEIRKRLPATTRPKHGKGVRRPPGVSFYDAPGTISPREANALAKAEQEAKLAKEAPQDKTE
eukprot:CAMPEP_0114562444 /NCGR_PEP_ID=MMETSP0114-20121206/12535_1 /TAXON_ID=31324 /ORGANISM="Goniomonas sp, Strain m" /LENGTH=223 /DNA_ID=CAMNT_0001748135 /DNA_START=91 /DNA_END=763 /DNA_ORIENTATION=-